MNQLNRKIGPSATTLIADALLDGECVDFGAWEATFQDVVKSDAENNGELSRTLLLFSERLAGDSHLREAIRTAAENYAERYEADWISARDKQRKDEAVRERDEERLMRECH